MTAEPPHCVGVADEGALRRALSAHAAARGVRILPAAVARHAHDILAAREIRETLDTLHAAGAQAIYCRVDVRDVPALTATLARVCSEWGPITGLVHGAGVLADRL